MTISLEPEIFHNNNPPNDDFVGHWIWPFVFVLSLIPAAVFLVLLERELQQQNRDPEERRVRNVHVHKT